MAILEEIANEIRATKAEVLHLKAQIEQNNKPRTDQLLSRKKAAEKCSVSILTISNWDKAGILSGHRIGGRVLYKESEINKAIEGKK